MTQDLRVAMTASLNDRLVAPLRRALDQVERDLKDVQDGLQATQRVSVQTSRTMAEINGPLKAARQVAELARNTEHAATAATRLERAWARAANMARGVGSGVAAWQAGKYVLAGPMQQAALYNKQLADAANIAYPYGERRAGMREMDTAVVSAVQGGGGTRESSLKAMQAMFAAGVDKKDVLALLPTVQKYATAGNADPENIADLVNYGLRSLKLPADQIPLMLDKTLASTKLGSMEFDSLAKWMPQVGAQGSQAALLGMKGYEQMLAAIQVSRLTAGTKDEGGTNLRDLLSLLSGHALQTAAKRMDIDSTGSIAAHIGKGGNALTGLIALADNVAKSDPRVAALDKKLHASDINRGKDGQALYTPEQEDIMRQQSILFQGSALGKLFHNQQSLQALVALRNNRDYVKQLLAGTGTAHGQVGQQDFETLQETPYFKMQKAANEELFAQTRALQGANGAVGRFSDQVTALYRKYPEFSTFLEGAKISVNALSAAAGAASVALLLLGRGTAMQAGAAAAGGAGSAAAAGAAGASARAAATRAGYSSLMNGPASEASAVGASAGSRWLARGGIAGMALGLAAELFYTSDEDKAILYAAERKRQSSYRGKNFDDPRRLDRQDGGVPAQQAAQVNVKVYIDGREMAAHVEHELNFQARRR